MTNPFEKLKNRFIAAEPAIAVSAGGAVVGYVMTALTTHGVITGVQATHLSQAVVPPVVSGFVLVLGWLTRQVVSPAATFAARVQAEVQKRLEQMGAAAPSAPAPLSINPGELAKAVVADVELDPPPVDVSGVAEPVAEPAIDVSTEQETAAVTASPPPVA
jgi:hypothetical protein